MILLNDILKLNTKELLNTKIRFNKQSNDYDPLTFFKENNDRLYVGQFWNYSKIKSFKVGQIAIGFIKITDDRWLLFDISIITEDLNLYNNIGYKYKTLHEYDKFFGRLIIKFKNKSQNMIRKADSVIKDCEVFEIVSDTFNDDYFPGYENVFISWKELSMNIEKKEWKTALENQKGVYLITDMLSGKRYVGSAYGEDMLLGRWKSYIKTGHGGNKDLKKLEFDYIKNNFNYSLLDIYKSTTDEKIIINREQYWMKVLLTKNKKFGYNN